MFIDDLHACLIFDVFSLFSRFLYNNKIVGGRGGTVCTIHSAMQTGQNVYKHYCVFFCAKRFALLHSQ